MKEQQIFATGLLCCCVHLPRPALRRVQDFHAMLRGHGRGAVGAAAIGDDDLLRLPGLQGRKQGLQRGGFIQHGKDHGYTAPLLQSGFGKGDVRGLVHIRQWRQKPDA